MNSNQPFQQLQNMFGAMSARQRLGIVAAVAGAGIALALFVHLMAKPEYDALASGLNPADAQEMARSLGTAGIPFEMSSDGSSLTVPVNDLDRARSQMAAMGLPRSNQTGFEVFDKPDWSGSDFAEQVNYQRALEGELERTIEGVAGVQSARVHLTMAHDSLFASDDRQAKAAVMLTLRGGLRPDIVNAVQHLVANSVDHLDANDVSVMDANGDMPGQQGTETQTESDLEASLRAKIVATLAPVVGAEHVRANVAVELDPTSADNTQETYDPGATVLLTSQSSNSGAAAVAAASGVAGTPSNLPGAKPAGTNVNAQLGMDGGAGGESSQSQTYAVSRTVSHTVRPAGGILRMTAAVVLDDATDPPANGQGSPTRRKRTAEELGQVQALAAAAIGINPTRGDSLTVSNLSFQAAPVLPAPAAQSWRDQLNTNLPQLIRYGGLLLLFLMVYMVLLRPLRKFFTTATRAVPPPAALPAGHAAAALTPAPAELAARSALQLRDQLAERVRREPTAASAVVQNWMGKPKGERA